MSEAETKELIKAFKKSTSTKKSSLAVLQGAGILDKNGQFTQPYSSLGKACSAIPPH